MNSLIIKLSKKSNSFDEFMLSQSDLNLYQIDINDIESFNEWDKLVDDMLLAKKIITLI